MSMTTTEAAGRRSELAAFLRSRRARLVPEDVGIPPGLRRRTPGLRREELAQLAGVGVTWYTWLEQGRAINASTQVLDAIARTLRLDAAEREHLYRLADAPLDPAPAETTVLPPTTQLVLDAVTRLPAVIFSGRYDLLAWNRPFGALFPSLVGSEPAQRNALWHIFTMPNCCGGFVNRDAELPHMVATLRAAFARHLGEPCWDAFVERLAAASPAFAAMWASHNVASPGPMTKIIQHWAIGRFTVVTASFAVSGAPEARMVVYTPAEADSAAALARLVDDPTVGVCCPRHRDAGRVPRA
jgi:transcriptional regulator with XRE-family HTH domain